jgi:cell division septation protein DedD
MEKQMSRLNFKNLTALIFFFVCPVWLFSAELKAKDISLEAARQGSVTESIEYIKKQITTLTSPAEKRSTLIFLASLQEQFSMYDQAQKSYVAAAGIASPDAEGMPKRTNEQLVLDAVRCALCTGDSATADSYLNSAVRNSRNPEIIAYVKLYAQWSALCGAESTEDLNEPLEILKAYLNVSSMDSVKPVILLTLWFITGEEAYSKRIVTDYSKSVEAAIVNGDVQLLPVPFWFFVPKTGVAQQGTGTFSSVATTVTSSSTSTAGASTSSSTATATTSAGSPDNSNTSGTPNQHTFTKWQLGLFRTESNATYLADELKKKGFAAYITTEKRASGTTYYIVLVNENADKDIADRLRSAGYDCYPVD